MNLGQRDNAVAYMKQKGMLGGFVGAPEWKPVSAPEAPRPITSSEDEYKYPEFKPVRDPLPEGVRYGRIVRELAHELQKVVTFEEDDGKPEYKRTQALLWMGLREQEAYKKRGRMIGQVFPVEHNPDVAQGGYRIWRR